MYVLLWFKGFEVWLNLTLLSSVLVLLSLLMRNRQQSLNNELNTPFKNRQNPSYLLLQNLFGFLEFKLDLASNIHAVKMNIFCFVNFFKTFPSPQQYFSSNYHLVKKDWHICSKYVNDQLTVGTIHFIYLQVLSCMYVIVLTSTLYMYVNCINLSRIKRIQEGGMSYSKAFSRTLFLVLKFDYITIKPFTLQAKNIWMSMYVQIISLLFSV